MAVYTIEEIGQIIEKNPAKPVLTKARERRVRNLRHIKGIDAPNGVQHRSYFESVKEYKQRKSSTISNRDLLHRILSEEETVFTTRGGSVDFGLGDKDKTMGELVSNVRYGMSLHKWMQEMALPAYRTDPNGIILMEIERSSDITASPKAYPTYKSTDDIFDYSNNGRMLDYVCFDIKKEQYEAYGIQEGEKLTPTSLPNGRAASKATYYRFIDDNSDRIIKYQDNRAVLATVDNAELPNKWGRVPAFIVSDLISFEDGKTFGSPTDVIIELAEEYLEDRSMRNFQKFKHAFAKAVEPVVPCKKCDGTGLIDGGTCGKCDGTGYNIHTTPSDTFQFPIEMLTDNSGFDYKKIFGYAEPPIDTLIYMDGQLVSKDALMYVTYWGTSNTSVSGFNGKQSVSDTATQVLVSLQPKISRLNKTANWAEQTETMITNLIGEYWHDGYKGARVTYGRKYMLQTTEEIANTYYEMCAKGAPDELKDEALNKLIDATYQGNPEQQERHKKLAKIIPFPHLKAEQVESSTVIPLRDKLAKRYGTEWSRDITTNRILSQSIKHLRQSLYGYVSSMDVE